MDLKRTNKKERGPPHTCDWSVCAAVERHLDEGSAGQRRGGTAGGGNDPGLRDQRPELAGQLPQCPTGQPGQVASPLSLQQT